jgi:hypothetical protein
MLLQIDGSPHDWLEGRGPRLVLLAGIDDATGEVPYALFREEEDGQGYLELMREIVKSRGRPMAVYHDGHGIFERSQGQKRSIEEEMAGWWEPTQFGRMLEELAIVSIAAHSPQAKGRVERLFGTLQDRLVTELRLRGAKSIEEANRVLWGFLPKFNKRFRVEAKEEGSAYRPVGEGFELDGVFCFKYRRVVGLDNVVRFYGQRLELLPTRERMSYAKAKVEVQEHLDGSLAIYYQGKCVTTKAAPLEAPKLRARGGHRRGISEAEGQAATTSGMMRVRQTDKLPSPPKVAQPQVPGPDHPWRKPSKKIIVTNSLNT